MALITYVGGAESDSFITVAEASTLLLSLVDDTSEWDLLNTARKELRLQMGAQLLGYLPLRGRTVFRGQRLAFPRTSQPYNQRFKIPSDVKKAHAFLSYSIIHRALASFPDMDSGAGISYLGVPSYIAISGMLMVTFKGDAGSGKGWIEKMVSSLPFPVYMMLKKYLSQVRGGAVGAEEDIRTLSTTTAPPPDSETTTTTTS